MTSRVVFLGSPQFALPSLRALHEDPRFEIPLVVSQPDRPAGRGRRLTPPPVAVYAQEAGLTLFQPSTLKADEAVQRLAEARPDLLVVVAYGEILRRNVLELAPGGALNVHPSLLPRYRGANPIAAAILNGDDETGVSIIKLVRKLDAGPIVAQQRLPIDPMDTTASLGDRLAELAADMLPDVCAGWLSGDLQPSEQDDDQASFTREWTKADAQIDWQRPAVEIERLVRASIPWPVAWTTLNGQRIQVRGAAVAQDADPQGEPGQVFRHGRKVMVVTGDEVLELLLVVPEGKKETPALNWWHGLRDSAPRFDSNVT